VSSKIGCRWAGAGLRPDRNGRTGRLPQQAVARSGLKVRNPCATRPVGRMSNLTEKVKTEIPVKPGLTVTRPSGAVWTGKKAE